ncbi:MAG: transcriptional repressor [Lachnospiraceae bacterium]|nr:transcriptional repressor [Lachnospiraceae bacterium]
MEEKKELIIKKLKEQGLRITKQRKLIIDAILESEYNCCKEIYCQVCAVDSSIGIATVYRMIRVLEDIGAIDRKNMYRVSFHENCNKDGR